MGLIVGSCHGMTLHRSLQTSLLCDFTTKSEDFAEHTVGTLHATSLPTYKYEIWNFAKLLYLSGFLIFIGN